MTSTSVVRQEDDGVLTLTLNRPERRNAIDADMRDALASSLAYAAMTPDVRAVVLTGADGAFCAGGDLAKFSELHDASVYRAVSHRLTEVVDALERLEKPVVAAIDGPAVGAGLTLALACDWRVASPRARLLYREGRLNMVPTHGGVTRLVKLVGLAAAKEAMLGGDDLDAQGALRLGLITEIAEEALPAAHARARKMLVRLPGSFAAAKRLLHAAADTDLRTGVLAESFAQTALLQSDTHREALAR